MFATALLQFDGIAATFGELSFALTIMAWVYVLYWLLQIFVDNQMLFFGSAVVASYVALTLPLPFLGFAVLLLLVNPAFIQNLIFGPVMSMQQLGQMHEQMEMMGSQKRSGSIQSRLQAGEAVEPEEMAWFQQQQQDQGGGQQSMQQAQMNPAMLFRRPGM